MTKVVISSILKKTQSNLFWKGGGWLLHRLFYTNWLVFTGTVTLTHTELDKGYRPVATTAVLMGKCASWPPFLAPNYSIRKNSGFLIFLRAKWSCELSRNGTWITDIWVLFRWPHSIKLTLFLKGLWFASVSSSDAAAGGHCTGCSSCPGCGRGRKHPWPRISGWDSSSDQ